ncbi:hypothetical protein F5Y17DRAFT_415000 [Xylariaceae sp. FL0594]|nr:hypothetical protein F5Y17DRAFT_415000 [Xylariaceae sp. FL0594]
MAAWNSAWGGVGAVSLSCSILLLATSKSAFRVFSSAFRASSLVFMVLSWLLS